MGRNIDEISIFGEYRTDEDRVTAAVLHVFRTGGEPLLRFVMNRIGIQLPDSSILIVSQPNDPGAGSRPDGLLRSKFSFNLYIESKITDRTIKKSEKQLREHKLAVTGPSDYLLYITPHNSRPDALDDVHWTNWRTLLEVLEEYVSISVQDDPELIAYLVEEFRKLVDNLNLAPVNWSNYGESDRVLILAGSWAEGIALKHNFYLCQNRRSFKPSGYISFYSNSMLSYVFKVAGEPEDDVDISKDKRFAEYRRKHEADIEKNAIRKYIPLELHAEVRVVNDKLDKNGKQCPYTYGQPRYTTIDRIKEARKTSEL